MSLFLKMMDAAEGAEEITVLVDGEKTPVGAIDDLALCEELLFASESAFERLRRKLLDAVDEYRRDGTENPHFSDMKQGLVEGEIVIRALKQRKKTIQHIANDKRLLPRYEALLLAIVREQGNDAMTRLKETAKTIAPTAWAIVEENRSAA